MSNSVSFSSCSHNNIPELSNTMATRIFSGQQYCYKVIILLIFNPFCKFSHSKKKNYFLRFIGFAPLIISNCDAPDKDIRIIYYNNEVQFDSYLNPLAILFCYYSLAIVSSFILNTTVSFCFEKIHFFF